MDKAHFYPDAPATLAVLLREGRAQLQQQTPGTEQDAATRAAMHRVFDAHRSRAQPVVAAPRFSFGFGRPLAWSGAAACAVMLIGATALLTLEPNAPLAPQPHLASDFVPVVSAERWQAYVQDSDAAPAWVVATEIPRERLALLGLPYDTGNAGGRVNAELLLHPSGDVLAVRVVR